MMKKLNILILALMIGILSGYFILQAQDRHAASAAKEINMKLNSLTPEEQRVIIHKGTEMPFTGKFFNHKEKGTYTCKQCDAPLYYSEDKFDSHCGWPSFDNEIAGAIKHVPDADGQRTEIVCSRCGAHLGHIFLGEGFTPKNVRHCVNSISLNFVPASKSDHSQKAYFAGGCFWGTEYFLQKAQGVLDAKVGYMGGTVSNPTYEQVCTGVTGHLETVEVTFDSTLISYEDLAKLFFEIHDPTQVDGQGPDLGEQYQSVIFYVNEEQRRIGEKLIEILKGNGFKVATHLHRSQTFWPAEGYHQDYYNHKGKQPYCHYYTKRF